MSTLWEAELIPGTKCEISQYKACIISIDVMETKEHN